MRILKNTISKDDAIVMLEICNKAISVHNKKEMKQLILSLDKLFSADYSYCFGASINELLNFKKNPHIEYLDVNYPQGMLELYLSQSMHINDPVAKEYIKTFKVQNWQECFKKNKTQGLLPVLHDRGIIDGYTHGNINQHSGIASIFSFACKSVDNKKRVKYILSLIIPHLSEALKRCLIPQANIFHLKSILTSREIEVLNWVKVGKTSWEISMILNISERTINFHINNIIKKLDACNRIHAVAIACSLGIIEVN